MPPGNPGPALGDDEATGTQPSQLPVNCSMRSDCDGPQATLTTPLGSQGVPVSAITILPDLRPAGRLDPAAAADFGVPFPPDIPPPRK